jgi:hypothetical protein
LTELIQTLVTVAYKFLGKLSGIGAKDLVERINNVDLLELVKPKVSFRLKCLGFPPFFSIGGCVNLTTAVFFDPSRYLGTA